MWGKGNLGALLDWWECGLLQPLWKVGWSYLKKVEMEQSYDPVIALLGIYPKNPKVLIQKNICTSMCTAALFSIAKIWKQFKCPSIDEWIEKLWYIYPME